MCYYHIKKARKEDNQHETPEIKIIEQDDEIEV